MAVSRKMKKLFFAQNTAAKIRMSSSNDSDCTLNDLDNKEEIVVTGAAIYEVHNDKAKEPDYVSMILLRENGDIITTSSEPAMNSMEMVMDAVSDVLEGELKSVTLRVNKKDSKNEQGKFIILSYVTHEELCMPIEGTEE